MTESRWTSLAWAAPVGQVEDADVDVHEVGELVGAGVVGAERSADAEQIGAQPQGVAALDRAWCLDAAVDGDAVGPGPGLDQRRLAGAVGLARPERDGTGIGHQDGVKGVDQVRVIGLRLQGVDVHAETEEQVDVGVVLALSGDQVDRVVEAVRRIVERGAEGRPRAVDEDLAQGRGHGSGSPGGGARIGHLSSVSWLVQFGQRVAISGISVAQ